MRAEISCGVYFLPSISSVCQLVPMCRLTLRMVRSTLVTAWFLADCPTRTSPFLAKATTDGVVREPSEFAMTVGSPPSRTATTELVVPRSMPTARAMCFPPLILQWGYCWGLLRGVLSLSDSSSSGTGTDRQTQPEPTPLNFYILANVRPPPDVPASERDVRPFAGHRRRRRDTYPGRHHVDESSRRDHRIVRRTGRIHP